MVFAKKLMHGGVGFTGSRRFLAVGFNVSQLSSCYLSAVTLLCCSHEASRGPCCVLRSTQ